MWIERPKWFSSSSPSYLAEVSNQATRYRSSAETSDQLDVAHTLLATWVGVKVGWTLPHLQNTWERLRRIREVWFFSHHLSSTVTPFRQPIKTMHSAPLLHGLDVCHGWNIKTCFCKQSSAICPAQVNRLSLCFEKEETTQTQGRQ
jgi:hypothetical protein